MPHQNHHGLGETTIPTTTDNDQNSENSPRDNEAREIFGYYEYYRKDTPDTVYDYLPNIDRWEEYQTTLKNLLATELRNLKGLLVSFDEYTEKVRKNRGKYAEGNMLLGAKPQEYIPSGEELVLAEIGKKIKSIVGTTPKDRLKEYLEQENITRKEIEYNYFTFIHYNVMGAGRFFYASDPIKEKVTFWGDCYG